MSEPFSRYKMTRDEYVTSSFVIGARNVLNKKYGDSENRMYLESIKEILKFYDIDVEKWIQLLDRDTLEPINVWASSFGRVKNGRGKPIWPKPKNNGYVWIEIKRKSFPLHTLIWVALNKKRIPEGYTVDHANEVPFDNRWVNIKEIKTLSEQRLESQNNGARKSDAEKRSRSIFGRKVGTSEWTQYNSAHHASRELNLDQGSVSGVCIGKRRHTGGYEFKYAEQTDEDDEVWRLAKYLNKYMEIIYLQSSEVSNKGRWKSSRGVIFKPEPCHNFPYAVVREVRKYLFHRVLATTFSDQIKGWDRVLADVDGKEEWVVDHIDDDPSNNALSNLQWITKRENTQKAMDALKLAAA
jgi:hypothetical protein